MTADLTPAQTARLEAIEAAPWAEEALPERVRVAIREALRSQIGRPPNPGMVDLLAVAVLDVMRGATDDGAIGRVLALAEEDERCVLLARQYGLEAATTGEQLYWQVMADVREQSAVRIRDAIGAPATAEGDPR